MRISRLSVATAMLVALSVPPAPAAAAEGYSDAALFDLYFGGIWAGTIDLSMTFANDAYRATARGRTEGLVGALYGASFDAEAQGAAPADVASGPDARPQAFRAAGTFGGDAQSLTITYGALGPQSVAADPPYKPKPYQIEPEDQTGVFDPLAATALLLRERPDGALCGAELDVFDGRRRSRVTLFEPKPGPVAGEILCDAALSRVAGWKAKDMDKPPFAFRLFFARPGDAPARLRRFEVDTGYGMATAVRRN
jgi:hypothetical protein